MQITVIRSNRKTVSIQVNEDLSVTVRAPQHTTSKEIEHILFEKKAWIEKHIEKMKDRKAQSEEQKVERLTNEEIQSLAERALEYIPKRVYYFARRIGVEYGRITIRNQKTRWGSCSRKGNLNFNCLLMLMPPEIIDYVIVHELCHRKEMNHSSAFWREVAKILPDYKKAEAWLKAEGGSIMRRV